MQGIRDYRKYTRLQVDINEVYSKYILSKAFTRYIERVCRYVVTGLEFASSSPFTFGFISLEKTPLRLVISHVHDDGGDDVAEKWRAYIFRVILVERYAKILETPAIEESD